MTFKELVKEQMPPQAIITIIFVAILAIGYGVWSEETNGTISLTAPAYGTQLYVDTILAGTAKTAGEKMSYQFSEGKHSVVISRGGFWPWERDFSLSSKSTETLNPFFVRQEAKPSVIAPIEYDNGTMSANPEYTDALAKFDDISVRQEFLPLLATTKIANARSAEYFPGRTDVLLVAVNDGIFAVETGTSTTPRNFETVYKGTSPVFVMSDNNTLLIKDGTSIFQMVGYEQ